MSSIKSDKISIVDIEQVIPNPKNANRHSIEQIKRLEKLIKYQGFRNPLIISNRTGFLVVGHGRLEAAINLGMQKVPVIYQDFESEAQEYAYLISDNEIARWAELDKQAVYEDLKEIELDDIELLGLEDFTLPDVDELDPQADEDEVPEVEHPITRRGDIWLLGKHRLMCGDSTMIDDVEKLMNGKKADMVFTDPPYGMFLDTDYSKMHKETGYNSAVGGKSYDKIKGDNNDFKEEFIQNIFTCFAYCKEIFLWGADYYKDLIPSGGSWIVWDKRSSENHANLDKLLGSAFELCWSKEKHKRDIARVLWSGHHGMNKEDTKKRCHPSQKPSGLCEWFLDRWGKDKNIIADVFLGSGSTLIACEKTNRKCYGMELDEKYCDIIINRWQNYTGKKATLESTGQTYEELQQERL
jgi:DNA modification methylase